MKRNNKIDILKGIAILLVVIGHSGFAWIKYIYLFHMAVFFMASGYFFKESQSDTIPSLIHSFKKRMLKIWLPFVVWNTIFTLLNNFFIHINVYTSDTIVKNYLDEKYVDIHSYMGLKDMTVNIVKGLFLAGQTGMGGTFWFLRILFYISVLYLFINFLLHNIMKTARNIIICQGFISFLFLGIGYYMRIVGIRTMGFDLMFSYYTLYYLGVILGRLTPQFEVKFTMPIFVILSILSAIGLGAAGNIGEIWLDRNNYTSPVFLLTVSIMGWVMLYSISSVLDKSHMAQLFFGSLGTNSLIIMIFHFLCFKPVSAVIALVKGWPMQTIAGFPISYNKGFWWILYTLVSTGLCMLIAFIWKKIRMSLK